MKGPPCHDGVSSRSGGKVAPSLPRTVGIGPWVIGGAAPKPCRRGLDAVLGRLGAIFSCTEQHGGMGNLDFDKRYPAMFQAGGDEPPVEGNAKHAADAGPAALATPEHAPAQARSQAAAQQPTQQPTPEGDSQGSVPMSVGASRQSLSDKQSISTEAVASSTAGTDPVRHWNGTAWLQGLAVSVLVIVAGLFCWTAQLLLLTARTNAPDEFHGLMVEAWGFSLVDIGVWFVVPGVAAFVLLLLMGARHYERWSHWLRAAVLVLGLVAASVALLALAAPRLFPRQFQPPWGELIDGEFVFEWPVIINLSVNPLIALALGILAAWLIVRPNGQISGAVAVGVAGVLLAVGLLGTFSAQLIPRVGQPGLFMQGDLLFNTTTWTQLWSQASPRILSVGVAVLSCATVARVMAKPRVHGAFENDLESEFAMDSRE